MARSFEDFQRVKSAKEAELQKNYRREQEKLEAIGAIIKALESFSPEVRRDALAEISNYTEVARTPVQEWQYGR